MDVIEMRQRIIAGANLVGRSGARNFEIGYLHEGVPSHEAAWFAQARFRGGLVVVEDYPSPVEAIEALVRRLLTGARCRCGSLVSLTDECAFAFEDPTMADGSKFPVEEAEAAGLCRWQRKGARWVSACGQGEYPS